MTVISIPHITSTQINAYMIMCYLGMLQDLPARNFWYRPGGGNSGGHETGTRDRGVEGKITWLEAGLANLPTYLLSRLVA